MDAQRTDPEKTRERLELAGEWLVWLGQRWNQAKAVVGWVVGKIADLAIPVVTSVRDVVNKHDYHALIIRLIVSLTTTGTSIWAILKQPEYAAPAAMIVLAALDGAWLYFTRKRAGLDPVTGLPPGMPTTIDAAAAPPPAQYPPPWQTPLPPPGSPQ